MITFANALCASVNQLLCNAQRSVRSAIYDTVKRFVTLGHSLLQPFSFFGTISVALARLSTAPFTVIFYKFLV